MKEYNKLVEDILINGSYKPNVRTGIGTLSVFGRQLRFDLQKNFPIVSSKKTNWKSAYIELLWYLKGTGDITFLKENGINIWDAWVKSGTSNLGRVYGVQWRHWRHYKEIFPFTDSEDNDKAVCSISEIDQVKKLIDTIKINPTDRRMIVNSWNVGELSEMQLPPCHMTWQCVVIGNKLNLHMLQRSVDCPIGLPWNLVCYAMLTHMIAHVCGLEVGDFVWTGVDVHIYENQIEQMKKMLDRPLIDNTPTLRINRQINDIDDFKIDDLIIENYKFHPFMSIPVAV